MARAAAVAVVIVGGLLLTATAAGRAGKAVLRVEDSSPLTLRGLRFQPLERVRVTVVIGKQSRTRQLRAGAQGGFAVRFRGLTLDYCASPLVLSARGASTGLVRVRLPIVDCAQP